MTELGFLDDGNGNLELANRTFDACSFEHLDIRLRLGKFAIMRNVKFLDCATTIGTCIITSGFTLDQVIFSNFDCHGAIHISSEAKLREVIIEGRRPQSLIIRPENEEGVFDIPIVDHAQFQVDISRFHGQVEIVGMRANMVQKDLMRHVGVKALWIDEVDWQELGIDKFSYWRIILRKLKVFNTTEGVFSLPSRSDEDYVKTMKEKEVLEGVGLCFE